MKLTMIAAALLSLSAANLAVADQAPDHFSFTFITTQGDMIFDCPAGWSPLGAQRIYDLIQANYFTQVAFFRVITGFVAQFGISGDPVVSAKWNTNIQDDPVKSSNLAGSLTFADAGPNTRSAQLFINLGDNVRLDTLGFSPVCKTDAAGLAVAQKLYAGYGEAASMGGTGPEQDTIYSQGAAYLRGYPNLDYILSTKLN